MAAHYLDFERPIAELDAKIDELSKLSETTGPGAFDAEIAALRARVVELRAEAYAHLNAWQKTQIARHPQRPHFVDYAAGLIEEFVELRGDRKFADDQAILGGLGRFRGLPVMVIGQEKGHDTTTRIKHNFGAARPEGYRKAVRLMDLAEQFNLPVLSFIDTGGAYPGIGGEERGVAAGEAVDVDGENIFTQQFVSRQMRDGRAEAAVGVVAFVALEPVVHFAFRILEHIKFLRGFSDMDADAPFSFERGAGGEAQQFR